ncbi:MAG: hypothetical protein KAG92_05105 [Deltaproteobacteria bacterium]|nr:hypothetical protein [Deltaproteobacteria bacterium]
MIKKPGFFSKLKSAFKRRKDTSTGVSDEVIESFKKQLEKTPQNFRLRLKLADSYLVHGERDEALAAYCETARLYLENDFTPLAIATYKKILNEEPEHLEANLELGHIYLQKKFFADATSYLRNAFDYCHENGLNDKSLQILETIIEIVPDKEPYRLLLKDLFPKHQESAKSIYSDIIISKKEGTSKPAPVTTSDNFFDLGAELDTEIDDIEDNPVCDQDILDPADVEEPSGVEEIFKTLRTTYHEDTNDSDSCKFHYNLALAYNELNMPEQALKESEEALKSDHLRPPTLLLRSRIFINQGALSTALSQVQQGLLEKGLSMQDFLTFKLQMGLILKKMGHHQKALEAFHEASSMDPENQEVADEIAALENSFPE